MGSKNWFRCVGSGAIRHVNSFFESESFGTRLLLVLSCLSAVHCTRLVEPGGEDIGSTQAAVSSPCANGPVLGFESPSGWTTTTGALSRSVNHTQGSYSLAVNHPVNYNTLITSPPLSSSDTSLSAIDIGTSLEVDLMLPRTQPNPYWYGSLQMFVTSASRGVYNQYLGDVELTGQQLGVFVTETFAIPNFVATQLHNQSFSDLKLTIVLNLPSSGTGTYLLDNLRIKSAPGSIANVHPNVVCVNNKGSGTYEALFGYSNENGDITKVPVGAANQITPGNSGQGQFEDFLPRNVAGAFAVKFNGGSLVWSLQGGCAIATTQTPACPTTACNPSCKYGQQCVGGTCVTECGDGLCGGDESCNTCPTDCACAAGSVCVQNGCATPVQCGIGWQCGSGTSFGVSVDCGACPSGKTCVNHLCK